jgi:hypothetical protein
MANLDAPRGLVPVRHANGAPYNGAGNIYYVPDTYDTALYIGDPVIPVTDSSDANGVPTVARATAGATNYAIGAIVAVMNGGDPAVPVTRDSPRYHPASTAGYVLVADDPDVLFEAQEDGAGGAMGVGAVGRNVDLIAGTGSNYTGYSGWQLDSNTLGTGNTLQMRIVAAVERADNDATLTNAKWLVKFNLHSLRNLTGV